ncbi:SOS-response transcriptional repressor LexA (RecA-mediated autopeptidase) (LexA) (PDB:1AY9) [Commensalibacter communis]|nr:SOS-response transcriptional repressor LexA (RecA-mediated autopeptidase) (LexA) (PDB:1AY9) [Commensalibacter communis]CAI3959476.1 SOS-response transcriptional repressor LexA (RecA-mediated autopeptidase) (LexA) (PDB:1AY9) [Commensalibacter communis]
MNMKNKILLDQIEKLLQEKKISARKASIKAGVGEDFIRNLKRYNNIPKTDKLIKLAQALDVNVNFFLNPVKKHDSSSNIEVNSPIPITTIYIRGEVQAGQWNTATEWPESDWIPLTVPVDRRYKHFNSFALTVKGDSMNLLYPEGTIVIAINFSDIGRNPEDGDCVITIRRDSLTDCYEATLKIIQIKEDGSVLLWPKSDNPNFVKPIILPKLTKEYQGNGMDGDIASTPDITIQSLVIGSYNMVGKMNIK